jgi:hypothetical protein
MTVYLWHLTALAIVGSIGAALGLIGAPTVGSASWWIAKATMIAAAAVVLAILVLIVGRAEQAAPRIAVNMSVWPTVLTVAIIAVAFEQITLHGLTTTGGMIATAVIAAAPAVLSRRAASTLRGVSALRTH